MNIKFHSILQSIMFINFYILSPVANLLFNGVSADYSNYKLFQYFNKISLIR